MARQHTFGQRLVRTLFVFFGPAQNGPPPYATPEELQAYREGVAPRTPTPPAAPDGFRVREVTGEDGVTRRYLTHEPEQPPEGG